ncbi:unnamed protein product [Phytophthora fragariaefolia]|uniref:Unnamed protein product n=1 Tax=Phytophthora fragariaefolia TaxID=1490495 RepID=A0A9W6TPC4_9STRA|nr:unnamed protein product [Phytophthora fragariaefolia]
MEPSFVANPYVQASAPSSSKIRDILNAEEALYETWRRTRKPVRLPYASKKLNNPLKSLGAARNPNQSKLPTAAACATNILGSVTEAGPNVAGQNRTQSQASITTDAIVPATMIKTRGALAGDGPVRSMEMLPSITGADSREKIVDLPKKDLLGDVMPSKGIRRRFQQYLYDFHSRQVFSYAKSEVEELEDTLTRNNPATGDLIDDTKSLSDEIVSSASEYFSTTRNEMGSRKRQRECLLSGMGFLAYTDYDLLFEADWKLSEAEKTVRDAVDRKRISDILRKAYRMLLWFFRYYAGNAAHAAASERRGSTGAMIVLGEGLFEISSRVRLLEDLNVQCVDPARFGITDSPLKRESLIDFILSVARMMCTHSPNPIRLRMVISEGIEMSDAVKILVHDHFGVFAQIQDVDHFRTLFLRKPEVLPTSYRHSSGGVHRRLREIIEIHKVNLTNFFDELVSAGAVTRNGNINDRGKVLQKQRGNGLVCTQFLKTLRAINLITSRGGPALTNISASNTGDAPAGPTGVDEVRAVRIFLSCLPMTVIDESSGQEGGAPAIPNSTTKTEPRELTLSQFIEALLRVAFTWKELQICHGGFDVCSNQMTSECCQCSVLSANYAFDVFDDAAEEIFARIHAYRLKRAQHRTSMRLKSINLKAHPSLHSLVALTTVQRAPTRIFPVDDKTISNDAGGYALQDSNIS